MSVGDHTMVAGDGVCWVDAARVLTMVFFE